MGSKEDKYSDLDTYKLSINEDILKNVTRCLDLYGEASLPEDVHKYKCFKCGKIFLAADFLWKDIGDGKWEPFCVECKEQLTEIK